MDFIIEIQQFEDADEQLLPKEIAIVSLSSEYVGHWIVAPPFPFDRLTERAQTRNNWASKFVHGIEWYEGSSSIVEVEKCLREICRGSSRIFTRGGERADYLQSVLSKKIIDLESFKDCPKLKGTWSRKMTCIVHATTRKPIHICALHQATSLRDWFREEECCSSEYSTADEKETKEEETQPNTEKNEHEPTLECTVPPTGFYKDRGVCLGYNSQGFDETDGTDNQH